MASKQAATSDMVARLHMQVTKIFGMSLAQMIVKLEEGEDYTFAVDPKLLNTVLKFISDNKIFALEEEELKDNPLAVQLAAIKAKQGTVVVPLVKGA